MQTILCLGVIGLVACGSEPSSEPEVAVDTSAPSETAPEVTSDSELTSEPEGEPASDIVPDTHIVPPCTASGDRVRVRGEPELRAASLGDITRRVDDALFIELSWLADTTIPLPEQADWSLLRVAFVMPLPEADQPTLVALEDVLLGLDQATANQGLRHATLVPGTLASCASLTRDGLRVHLVVALTAEVTGPTLTGMQQWPIAAEATRSWYVADVPERPSYAGECGASTPAYAAEVVPLQAYEGRSIRAEDWSDVERDCAAAQGCYAPSHPCGDGDRWTCMQCFGSLCLQAYFQSECSPD